MEREKQNPTNKSKPIKISLNPNKKYSKPKSEPSHESHLHPLPHQL